VNVLTAGGEAGKEDMVDDAELLGGLDGAVTVTVTVETQPIGQETFGGGGESVVVVDVVVIWAGVGAWDVVVCSCQRSSPQVGDLTYGGGDRRCRAETGWL
jgi:hypothetical protein